VGAHRDGEEPILDTLAAIDTEAQTGPEHLRAFVIHDGIEMRVVFRRYYHQDGQILRARMVGLRRDELRFLLPALQKFVDADDDAEDEDNDDAETT